MAIIWLGFAARERSSPDSGRAEYLIQDFSLAAISTILLGVTLAKSLIDKIWA